MSDTSLPQFLPNESESARTLKLNQFVKSIQPVMSRLTQMFAGYRPIVDLPAGTTSFSVAKRHQIYRTANTGATTLTAITDGVEGMEIVLLVRDANTTIDFTGTTLKGNSGVDWSPSNGDHLRAIFDGTNWVCEVFSVP